MFKKVLALVLTLAMVASLCFALASCGEQEDDSKGMSAEILPAPAIEKDFEIGSDFKIGLICLHDEKSTYDLNFIKAMENVQKALELSDEQVIIKTGIPEGTECYEMAKDLVSQGCKVIFADSFGHEDFMIKAAKEFPEVQFCHATGTKAHTEGLANYHNAFASIYEGRYLAGVAAGMKLNEMIANGTEIKGVKVTAENAKIGYVGAFTYAEVISGYTSFFLGARSVCPTVTMDVQFTGSWYDAVEERNAALALIGRGCNLISQHADSLGAPSACEENGVPNVSYNGATYDAGPNTFIVSSAINWAPYYKYIIKCVCTGEAIAADWTGTISTGSVVLSGINLDVAAEGTEAKLKELAGKFKDGSLKAFDVSTFKVGGVNLTSYTADVDTDPAYTPDKEVIIDGYFHESEFRSAPYFDIRIDDITLVNEKY